jgi:IS30 family transposase
MATHLTPTEREVLCRLHKAGKSNAEIGRLMGRHRGTIGRELTRNAGEGRGGGGYCPRRAQRLADARRGRCRRRAKLDDPALSRFVGRKLRSGWSPQQVAGRLPREFPHRRRMRVSRQAIYDWIDRRAPHWRPLLRRAGRPRAETRGRLAGTPGIRGRPAVVNGRRRYGDWEGDTILAAGGHRGSALVTLVERKSGYVRLGRAGDLTAATTARVVGRRLACLPPGLRRTLTLDNGKEFAGFAGHAPPVAAALDLAVYFAAPRRPWQRGTCENTNGLLRQFFPKGTDFAAVTNRRVARVEALLNDRPRKRLDYRTPAEVLEGRLCCD